LPRQPSPNASSGMPRRLRCHKPSSRRAYPTGSGSCRPVHVKVAALDSDAKSRKQSHCAPRASEGSRDPACASPKPGCQAPVFSQALQPDHRFGARAPISWLCSRTGGATGGLCAASVGSCRSPTGGDTLFC